MKTIIESQEFYQAVIEAVEAERKRVFEENKEIELQMPKTKKIGPYIAIKAFDWLKFQESLEFCVSDIVYLYNKLEELEQKLKEYKEKEEAETKRTVDELIAEAKVECAESNFERQKESFEQIYKRKYKNKEIEEEER